MVHATRAPQGFADMQYKDYIEYKKALKRFGRDDVAAISMVHAPNSHVSFFFFFFLLSAFIICI